MIVVGVDPHMKTHTAVALDCATGKSLGVRTVTGDKAGHEELLCWARKLDAARTFAIEDCRHISGRLERHLLPRGEHVVRVSPKLMALSRASSRVWGKSDPIDAASVARACLREPDLPKAALTGPEGDVRLLADHRDDLVAERARIQKRLRWHCHDLDSALAIPPRALDRYVWLDRLNEALSALPDTVRCRIALEELSRCRDLTKQIRTLESEIRRLVCDLAPDLLAIPGCSVICAAHLIGQTGSFARFKGEASFAMHAGCAPLPVSSGTSTRHRLSRSGNRKLNSVIHMIALTQARMYLPAITYIDKKRAEGMSYREALRCLKRLVARTIYKTMVRTERAQAATLIQANFGTGITATAV